MELKATVASSLAVIVCIFCRHPLPVTPLSNVPPEIVPKVAPESAVVRTAPPA